MKCEDDENPFEWSEINLAYFTSEDDGAVSAGSEAVGRYGRPTAGVKKQQKSKRSSCWSFSVCGTPGDLNHVKCLFTFRTTDRPDQSGVRTRIILGSLALTLSDFPVTYTNSQRIV